MFATVSLHLARESDEELYDEILLLALLVTDVTQPDENPKKEWRELIEDTNHTYPARDASQ